MGLNKQPSYVVFSGATGANAGCLMPLAIAAKPLKRRKTAMGSHWKKLAWIWVWRYVG
jgi:hypothetical protein